MGRETTTTKRRRLEDESGFAVLELVVAVPLLVIIVAGLADLTVWIRTFMLSSEASTAAAASFMHSESAPSASSLKASVLAACPDIEGCDAKLSMTTERQSNPSTVTFTHETDSAGAIGGAVDKTAVKVTCTVRRGWTSYIGPAISNAMGLGGDCIAWSTRCFTYEEVSESGWSSEAVDESD